MTIDCPRTETNVFLNVQELGVILSALQLLDHTDEHLIARQYGPCTRCLSYTIDWSKSMKHWISHRLIFIMSITDMNTLTNQGP